MCENAGVCAFIAHAYQRYNNGRDCSMLNLNKLVFVLANEWSGTVNKAGDMQTFDIVLCFFLRENKLNINLHKYTTNRTIFHHFSTSNIGYYFFQSNFFNHRWAMIINQNGQKIVSNQRHMQTHRHKNVHLQWNMAKKPI